MVNLRLSNLLVSTVVILCTFMVICYLLSVGPNAPVTTPQELFPASTTVFRYASRAIVAEAQRARYVFSRWNKPIPIYSRSGGSHNYPVLRPSARFQVSARFSTRPNVHPRGETVHELSFFVRAHHVTQKFSDALVRCVDAANEKEWSLYNAEQFSDDTTQIEYFVSLSSNAAHEWRRRIHAYLINEKERLDSCIGKKDVIIYAQHVQVAHELPRNFIGEENCILKVIAALFALIALEISVLLRLRKNRKSATGMKKNSRRSRTFSNVYPLRSNIY